MVTCSQTFYSRDIYNNHHKGQTLQVPDRVITILRTTVLNPAIYHTHNSCNNKGNCSRYPENTGTAQQFPLAYQFQTKLYRSHHSLFSADLHTIIQHDVSFRCWKCRRAILTEQMNEGILWTKGSVLPQVIDGLKHTETSNSCCANESLKSKDLKLKSWRPAGFYVFLHLRA